MLRNVQMHSMSEKLNNVRAYRQKNNFQDCFYFHKLIRKAHCISQLNIQFKYSLNKKVNVTLDEQHMTYFPYEK